MTILDIVIPSFKDADDRGEDLEFCVQAVREYTEVAHRVLVERSNASAAENRNRALAKVSAPYVCFLDDDAWVTPGWAGVLLRRIQSDATIAMAGPKLKFETGRIFCTGIDYVPPDDFAPMGQGDADDGKHDFVHEPFAIAATCLVVKTEAVHAVGGFDEQFRSCQWEDLDYFLRLKSLGFRGVVDCAATVYHRNQFRTTHYEKNKELFMGKWKGKLDGFRPGLP